MSWSLPIFDRTSEDVLKVQTYDTIGFKYLYENQKREWMSRLKGALNYFDLNRIEGNTEFLANLYEITGLTFKTNWQMTDIPERSDFQRIIDNINTLRTRGKVLDSTPKTPSLPFKCSYEDK